MLDRNREYLTITATLLRPLLDELVFIGGAVTGLLVTDPAAADPRVTVDVDVVAEILSYAEYAAFGDRLRKLGFAEDSTDDAPVCRWVCRSVILDVLPLDESILGFSNRWYRVAFSAAEEHRIAPGLSIRVLPAPYFVATKLEAFGSRGRDDINTSKDLEDIVTVLDGRPSLPEEVSHCPQDLIAFLRIESRQLLARPRLEDILAGYLLPDAASQARIPLIIGCLRNLAAL